MDEKMKQAKSALTARMMILAAGLFLVFNAVSSNFQYGMTYLNLSKIVLEDPETDASETEEDFKETEKQAGAEEAAGAEKAAAEEAAGAEDSGASQEIDVKALKADMKRLGVTADDFHTVGIAFLVMAVIRILAGVFCVVFANRVDKSSLLLKVVIGLAVFEAAFAVLLFLKKALALGALLYAVLILVFLFWGVLKLRKMSKEDPERVYAVQSVPKAAPAQPVPKKSIRERAMMNTETEPSSDGTLDGSSDGTDGSESEESLPE